MLPSALVHGFSNVSRSKCSIYCMYIKISIRLVKTTKTQICFLHCDNRRIRRYKQVLHNAQCCVPWWTLYVQSSHAVIHLLFQLKLYITVLMKVTKKHLEFLKTSILSIPVWQKATYEWSLLRMFSEANHLIAGPVHCVDDLEVKHTPSCDPRNIKIIGACGPQNDNFYCHHLQVL